MRKRSENLSSNGFPCSSVEGDLVNCNIIKVVKRARLGQHALTLADQTLLKVRFHVCTAFSIRIFPGYALNFEFRTRLLGVRANRAEGKVEFFVSAP
jgi:hypothetical protein